MKVYNIALGDNLRYEKIRYPAGELQVRLRANELSEFAAADIVTVTACVKTAEDLIETCLLCSAMRVPVSNAEAAQAGSRVTSTSSSNSPASPSSPLSISSSPKPKDVVLILPYLPYARADRRFIDGDCFGLEVFANILNGLDVSIVSLDVHSDKSTSLIRGLRSLSPTPLIEMAIKQTLAANDSSRLTLLFPDDGARKRYSALAQELDVDVLHCMKVRDKVTGKLSRFSVPDKGEFKTSNVLLIDDICDGGGTFLGIADALADYGLNLSLYVTHGIFSKGLEPLLKRFKTMYATDSFNSGQFSPRLVIFPTANLFEEAMRLPVLQTSNL